MEDVGADDIYPHQWNANSPGAFLLPVLVYGTKYSVPVSIIDNFVSWRKFTKLSKLVHAQWSDSVIIDNIECKNIRYYKCDHAKWLSLLNMTGAGYG